MNVIIFFIFFLFNSSSLAGAFTENTANANTAGTSTVSKTVVPIPLQNIVIGTSLGYIGQQIYESGGMASIGLLPESVKNLSPLAYEKQNFILQSNPKLKECKKIIDVANYGLNNNARITMSGCASIGTSFRTLKRSTISAIKYLE
tara:strand:- start:1850 stop:2287 length:438 start_codon:yes stop_codon:yes gene_type:complete